MISDFLQNIIATPLVSIFHLPDGGEIFSWVYVWSLSHAWSLDLQ